MDLDDMPKVEFDCRDCARFAGMTFRVCKCKPGNLCQLLSDNPKPTEWTPKKTDKE